MASYFVSVGDVERLVREFDERLVQPMIAAGQLRRNHYGLAIYDILDEREVFAELFIPDGATPDGDYLRNARGKIDVCIDSNYDSSTVVHAAPEMLERGHFRHPGGVILGRWAIAISGFAAYDDMVLAQMLGWYLRRFAFVGLANFPGDVHFIGEE